MDSPQQGVKDGLFRIAILKGGACGQIVKKRIPRHSDQILRVNFTRCCNSWCWQNGESVRIQPGVDLDANFQSGESVRIAIQPGRPCFFTANSLRVRLFSFPSERLGVTVTA